MSNFSAILFGLKLAKSLYIQTLKYNKYLQMYTHNALFRSLLNFNIFSYEVSSFLRF